MKDLGGERSKKHCMSLLIDINLAFNSTLCDSTEQQAYVLSGDKNIYRVHLRVGQIVVFPSLLRLCFCLIKLRQKRTEGAEESRHTECDSDGTCSGISVALRGHKKKKKGSSTFTPQPATIETT